MNIGLTIVSPVLISRPTCFYHVIYFPHYFILFMMLISKFATQIRSYVQLSIPSYFQRVKSYFLLLLQNELQHMLQSLHPNKAEQALLEAHLTVHVFH
jgi:uncharacterized membrane protein YesL